MSRPTVPTRKIAGMKVEHYPWVPDFSLVSLEVGETEIELSVENARALMDFLGEALRLHDEILKAADTTSAPRNEG